METVPGAAAVSADEVEEAIVAAENLVRVMVAPRVEPAPQAPSVDQGAAGGVSLEELDSVSSHGVEPIPYEAEPLGAEMQSSSRRPLGTASASILGGSLGFRKGKKSY